MLNDIVIDETPGHQPDTNETTDAGVIGLFSTVTLPGHDPDMPAQYATGSGAAINATINFGADGPLNGNAVTATAYSLNVANGTDSGLATTEGKEIFLFKEGNLVVGRFDSNGDTHVDGTDNAAFAIAMDSTGKVSVALYVSLEHPDQATPGNGFNSYDEGIYLNNGTLSATVTVTDGDGDTASQSADISKAIRFEDDGPTVSGVTYDQHGPNLIVNGSFEQGHAELTGSDWSIYSAIPGWTEGADGIPFEVQTGAAGGLAAQDGNALIELDGDTTGNPAHQPPQGTPDPVHTDATIQQTIATTAGEDYVLTFYYSPRPDHSGGSDGQPNNDSGLNVLWNGVVVDSIDSTNLPSGLAADHAACDRHRQRRPGLPGHRPRGRIRRAHRQRQPELGQPDARRRGYASQRRRHPGRPGRRRPRRRRHRPDPVQRRRRRPQVDRGQRPRRSAGHLRRRQRHRTSGIRQLSWVGERLRRRHADRLPRTSICRKSVVHAGRSTTPATTPSRWTRRSITRSPTIRAPRHGRDLVRGQPESSASASPSPTATTTRPPARSPSMSTTIRRHSWPIRRRNARHPGRDRHDAGYLAVTENLNIAFGADGENEHNGLVITSWTDLPGVTETLSPDGTTLTRPSTAARRRSYVLQLNNDGTYTFTQDATLPGSSSVLPTETLSDSYGPVASHDYGEFTLTGLNGGR